MYTYIIVFYYTKNKNSYFPSKIITLDHLFGKDDVEIQKAIALASGEYDTKTIYIHDLIEIAPSRKTK